MNKTARIETRRVYLLQNLPEPLKRSDYHWQIFDNYIENTRLRLRSIRVPETKEWTYVLEQRFPVDETDLRNWHVAQIFLNETEHHAFEIYEGREVKTNERVETNEIRKNRYFYDSDEKKIEIDLFLGELWGLILAKVFFEDEESAEDFQLPVAVAEVTNDEFFVGANLIGKKFADIQTQFEKINS